MVYLKANIENQNKEISSSVARYAICGNASWTVRGEREKRTASSDRPRKRSKASLGYTSIS
jgi:hypothetical protein